MKRVTITFDNGPTAGVTDDVLEVLAAHGVVATFFVIGQKAATYEGRVRARRAAELGHRVGNHTWTHSVPFGELDDRAVKYEIDDTVRLVNALGGEGLLFRPYGVGGVMDHRLMSPFGAAHLTSIGATVVSWTCVPGDWYDQAGWVERALADIDASDWSVVVLHDVADACSARLSEFLTAAAARG
ncbi:MAG: polysaccharide deacetylase family protein, partial [Actinobacteria bacterium]|nr:polysaccharide deacetylase family protein [Actinomycetota bacterium]